jgi:hypothetical protein
VTIWLGSKDEWVQSASLDQEKELRFLLSFLDGQNTNSMAERRCLQILREHPYLRLLGLRVQLIVTPFSGFLLDSKCIFQFPLIPLLLSSPEQL